jgi:hypothetical protein
VSYEGAFLAPHVFRLKFVYNRQQSKPPVCVCDFRISPCAVCKSEMHQVHSTAGRRRKNLCCRWTTLWHLQAPDDAPPPSLLIAPEPHSGGRFCSCFQQQGRRPWSSRKSRRWKKNKIGPWTVPWTEGRTWPLADRNKFAFPDEHLAELQKLGSFCFRMLICRCSSTLDVAT